MKGIGATVRRVMLPLLASGLLAGCITPVAEGVKSEALSGLAPAPLPRHRVGDRRRLDNGRWEEVIAVDGDTVTWRTSGGTRYRTGRNFILPDLEREGRRYRVTNLSDVAEDLLWPLQQGNSGRFASRRSSLDKRSGQRKSSSRDFHCEVDGSWRLDLAAGTFSTYRVVCERSNGMGQFRQRRYWYYAPELEQVVLQVTESPGRPIRRRELLAFHPSLEHLGEAQRRAFDERFQWAMEHQPAGSTLWLPQAGRHRQVGITPLRTMKLKDGHYCRSYRILVGDAGGDRVGAGIVCRSGQGRWRVPGRNS